MMMILNDSKVAAYSGFVYREFGLDDSFYMLYFGIANNNKQIIDEYIETVNRITETGTPIDPQYWSFKDVDQLAEMVAILVLSADEINDKSNRDNRIFARMALVDNTEFQTVINLAKLKYEDHIIDRIKKDPNNPIMFGLFSMKDDGEIIQHYNDMKYMLLDNNKGS